MSRKRSLAEGDGAQRREQAARRLCEPVGCGECSRRERHRGEEGGGEVGESDGELQLLRERGVGRVVEERPSPIPPESRIRCGLCPVRRVVEKAPVGAAGASPTPWREGQPQLELQPEGEGEPPHVDPSGEGEAFRQVEEAHARDLQRGCELGSETSFHGGYATNKRTLETVSRPPTVSEAGMTRREDSPSENAGSLTHARGMRL